jgi:hypothetical protein
MANNATIRHEASRGAGPLERQAVLHAAAEAAGRRVQSPRLLRVQCATAPRRPRHQPAVPRFAASRSRPWDGTRTTARALAPGRREGLLKRSGPRPGRRPGPGTAAMPEPAIGTPIPCERTERGQQCPPARTAAGQDFCLLPCEHEQPCPLPSTHTRVS